MNEELQKKLLNDLEKTGFHSEMRAIKVFNEFQWRTSGASSYYDLDSNISREIDIKAYLPLWKDLDDGRRVQTFYQIVGEVKKANNPWIVFKSRDSSGWELVDAWTNLITHENLPSSTSSFVDTISAVALPKKLGWKGYGVHESFKAPNAPSRWYSAFVSACKAGESVLKANTRVSSEEDKNIYLFFVKPIVILDGILISAELTDKGDVLLDEIDAAPFHFSYKSPQYNRLHYSVDIVRLSGLDDYLQLSKLRLETIFDALVKAASDK